jgi:riboflavin kinase
VESGVYYGWAGLSPSSATKSSPPGQKSGYKLMKGEIYDDLLESTDYTSSNGGDGAIVYPMVMSIGWNPYYKNTKRSVEVHIMHDFSESFYNSHMNLVVLGFIRPEYDYVSLESLVDDIKTDIDVAGRSLTREAYLAYRQDQYLKELGGSEIAS